MPRDLNQKIVRNTIATLFSRLFSLAITIFLTPYILTNVGDDEFGIWILITAVVGYVGLLDLGFGTSFARFVAEFAAKDEQRGINGVVTAGVLFYTMVSPLLVLLVLTASDVLVVLLNVPDELEATTTFVMRLGVASLLWANLNGVFHSVINGLQRMDIYGVVMVIQSILFAVGSVAALRWGYGIRGLAIVQLASQAIIMAVSIYLAIKLCPGLRPDLRMAKRHFLSLLRYGANLQVGNFAGMINFQLDKVLLNRFINPASVTLYEVGSRIPLTARNLPMLLLSPLGPAAAELSVRESKRELYDLYTKASRYGALLAIPIFTGLSIVAHPLLRSWVGPGYEASAGVLRILCFAFVVNLLSGPAVPMLQGMGRPEFQRNAEGLGLLVNVVLSVILIRQYGLYGACVGTTVSTIIASAYYLWAIHRVLQRSAPSWMRVVYSKPIACSLIAGAFGLIANTLIERHLSPSGRIPSFLTCAGVGVVFVFAYIVLVWNTNFLEPDERELIYRRLPVLRFLKPFQR